MNWSMTKPKRKKKRNESSPSWEFQNLKGSKRVRLIAERKTKGYTQAQLGALVGCSGSMISSLESGRLNPSLEVALQLEVVLQTPYFELFPDL
ncbi:helix-turn-helix transcriptional regulator [Lysinibacillus sp. NPDC097195]|uniref:helix-turn-helix transcriptional regulator n=1 Tax=Lysinibacillus sp. NPDC097195 TaxID=3364141 RepID=UPI00380A225E